MIAHYMNKLIQGDFTYYDLRFFENNVVLGFFGGVIFNNTPDFVEMENRAIEISDINLSGYTITEIVIDN